MRSTNEDRMGWTRTRFGDVYVVSDGMGGHRGGALAAELTVRSLQSALARILPNSERFVDEVREAFDAANDEVHRQRDPDNPETCEMGATAVALITSGTRFIVAHVGDSRAYLWRRSTGLRQLTHDHTRVQSMLDGGLLTAEQAAVHPDASILERAIGNQASVQSDVSEWIPVTPGDRILLCSDGLCGYVSDREISDVLRADDDPQPATDRLIDCALAKGGEDNVTVQLVGYKRGRRKWLAKLVSRSRHPMVSPLLAAAVAAVVGAGGVAAWYAPRVAQLKAELASIQSRSSDVPVTGSVPAPAAKPAAPAPSPTPDQHSPEQAPIALPLPAGPLEPDKPHVASPVPKPGASPPAKSSTHSSAPSPAPNRTRRTPQQAGSKASPPAKPGPTSSRDAGAATEVVPGGKPTEVETGTPDTAPASEKPPAQAPAQNTPNSRAYELSPMANIGAGVRALLVHQSGVDSAGFAAEYGFNDLPAWRDISVSGSTFSIWEVFPS